MFVSNLSLYSRCILTWVRIILFALAVSFLNLNFVWRFVLNMKCTYTCTLNLFRWCVLIPIMWIQILLMKGAVKRDPVGQSVNRSSNPIMKVGMNVRSDSVWSCVILRLFTVYFFRDNCASSNPSLLESSCRHFPLACMAAISNSKWSIYTGIEKSNVDICI